MGKNPPHTCFFFFQQDLSTSDLHLTGISVIKSSTEGQHAEEEEGEGEEEEEDKDNEELPPSSSSSSPPRPPSPPLR